MPPTTQKLRKLRKPSGKQKVNLGEAKEGPYLTHHVQHLGQTTLIPPENMGRIRKTETSSERESTDYDIYSRPTSWVDGPNGVESSATSVSGGSTVTSGSNSTGRAVLKKTRGFEVSVVGGSSNVRPQKPVAGGGGGETEWERDRRVGYSLDERVRREFERKTKVEGGGGGTKEFNVLVVKSSTSTKVEGGDGRRPEMRSAPPSFAGAVLTMGNGTVPLSTTPRNDGGGGGKEEETTLGATPPSFGGAVSVVDLTTTPPPEQEVEPVPLVPSLENPPDTIVDGRLGAVGVDNPPVVTRQEVTSGCHFCPSCGTAVLPTTATPPTPVIRSQSLGNPGLGGIPSPPVRSQSMGSPLVIVGGNSPSPPQQQQVSDPEPVSNTKAVDVGAVTRQDEDSPVISPSPSSLGCVPSIAATAPTTIPDPPPPPRSPSLDMQITNGPLRVTNPDLEQEEEELHDSDSTAVTPSQRTGNEKKKAKELVVVNGEEDSIRRPLMVSAPPSQVKNGEKEGGSGVVHAKEQDSGAVNRYEERRPPMVSAPPSFSSTLPNGHTSPDSTPIPNEPSSENPVPTPQPTNTVHPKEQDSGAVNRYDEVKENRPPMVSAPPSFSSPTNTPATPKPLRSILKVDERLVDARGVTVPRRKREESREEAVPKSPRAALVSAPPSLSSPTSSPSQPQSPSSASPIKVAPRAAHRRLTSLYFPFGIVSTAPDTSRRPLPPVPDVGDVSRNRRRPGMTRSWSGSIAPPTHSFDGIDIPGRKRMSLPTQKSTGMDRHQRSQSIPASQRIPMHFLMSPSSLSLQSPSLRSPSSVSLQSPISQFRSPSTTSLHSPGFQLRSPSNVSLHSPSSNLRSPSNVSLHSPGSNLRSPSNVSLLPPGAAPAQWSQRLDSQAEEGSESTHTHHAPTNLSQRPPLSPLISPSAVSLLPPGAAPASPVGPLPIFGRDLTELDLLVARIDDPETRNGANYEALLALGEILGPAPGSIAHDVPAITPMPELNLPESPVKVARRRLTKDGKIRVKLTLKNHPVERCGICLAQFKEGDAGTWLKCKHPFHARCLRPWTTTSRTCPTCRATIPS